MKMELFQKKINAGHWRTLQPSGDMLMLPDLQLNWSTCCLENPPNC